MKKSIAILATTSFSLLIVGGLSACGPASDNSTNTSPATHNASSASVPSDTPVPTIASPSPAASGAPFPTIASPAPTASPTDSNSSPATGNGRGLSGRYILTAWTDAAGNNGISSMGRAGLKPTDIYFDCTNQLDQDIALRTGATGSCQFHFSDAMVMPSSGNYLYGLIGSDGVGFIGGNIAVSGTISGNTITINFSGNNQVENYMTLTKQ